MSKAFVPVGLTALLTANGQGLQHLFSCSYSLLSYSLSTLPPHYSYHPPSPLSLLRLAAPLGVQLLALAVKQLPAPSSVCGFSTITAAFTSVSASFLNVQSWSSLLEVGQTNNKQKQQPKTLEDWEIPQKIQAASQLHTGHTGPQLQMKVCVCTYHSLPL